MKLKNVTLIGVDCVDINRLKLAMDICQENFKFAEVKLLTSLDCYEKNVVQIDHINSLKEYSEFILRRLDDYFTTSHVLLIQYDGFILNPAKWTDEFLKYDYIGAPWWYKDSRNVGNGGFSLRSKKLTSMLKTDAQIKKLHPEDHRICRTYGDYLKHRGIKFAPEALAAQFAIEGCLGVFRPVKFGNVWTDEFGFHGLSRTDISNWTKEHPQFRIHNPAAKHRQSPVSKLLTKIYQSL